MSVAGSSVAGASGSSRTTPVLNVLSVFAAHFHVRRGNEVIWAAGLHTVEQLSKQGVEWKVLPSGSHLLDDDIIFFDVAQEQAADKHGHLVGVAAFKNRRLRDDDRTGAGADADDNDDQRGARMMAVGAIVDCGSQRTPWTQLAATLPHTCQLEKLVTALSGDPSCRNILQEWLDTHQRKTPFLQSPNRQINMEGIFYPHDPLLMLPAVSNALGPYLPCLIKSLMITPFRLLLFVPPGSKSLQAASIAFNLAELVYTACQSPSKSSHDRCPMASVRTTTGMESLHGLDVKGLVGLHDVDRLKMLDEDKDARGWIAYTSDRILLEKLNLFDGLLDLSPMMHSHDTDLVDATALPRYRRTVRLAVEQNGKREIVSRKQNWTTREFAVFRGLDERAALDASSARHVRKALNRKRASSGSQITIGSASDVNDPTSTAVRRSPVRHPSTSTLIAFLTFWLSSLRFLPQRWRINLRESYGYVPLSIRSDGGIRASIMLLPTSDEEDDEFTDDEQAGESQISAHLSVPASVGQQAVRQRSYSNALSVDGEEQQESDIVNDPILAAVGAGSFAHRRRNSRTVSSGHRSAAQLASEVASIHGGDGRPISPELSIQRDRTSIVRADEEWREAERDARESVRLALCLFAAWSSWVEDLVLSIQDIVQDNLASDDLIVEHDAEQMDGDANVQPVNRADDERPLLKRQQDDASTVLITSSNMSQIGLSNTNSIDVALVRFLASTVTARAVEIERGWSILSWLCW